jgi:hypothetical protein
MTKPRRRLSCGQGRDFFRLAAAFAHADTIENPPTKSEIAPPKDDLFYSKYLQARYQGRSAILMEKTDNLVVVDDKARFIHGVMEKWLRSFGKLDSRVETHFLKQVDVSRWLKRGLAPNESLSGNGVSFTSREMCLLLSIAEDILTCAYLSAHKRKMPGPDPCLSALDFHRAFLAFIEDNNPRPFFVVAQNNQQEVRFLVETARLFWSHRLQTKSLQASNSAEPSICYFHAALRSNLKGRIDYLYWLRLDEEKVAKEGDFIEINDHALYPKDLFFPQGLLFNPSLLKECQDAMDLETRDFIDAVREFSVMQ